MKSPGNGPSAGGTPWEARKDRGPGETPQMGRFRDPLSQPPLITRPRGGPRVASADLSERLTPRREVACPLSLGVPAEAPGLENGGGNPRRIGPLVLLGTRCPGSPAQVCLLEGGTLPSQRKTARRREASDPGCGPRMRTKDLPSGVTGWVPFGDDHGPPRVIGLLRRSVRRKSPAPEPALVGLIGGTSRSGDGPTAPQHIKHMYMYNYSYHNRTT